MAQDAGVTDVWAKYGEAHLRPEYQFLRRVTHWPRSAVERERTLEPKQVVPSYVLNGKFSEMRDLFEFSAFRPHM